MANLQHPDGCTRQMRDDGALDPGSGVAGQQQCDVPVDEFEYHGVVIPHLLPFPVGTRRVQHANSDAIGSATRNATKRLSCTHRVENGMYGMSALLQLAQSLMPGHRNAF